MQIIFFKKQDMEVIVSIYGYLPEPKSKKCSWVSKELELSTENHRQGRFSPFYPSLSGCAPLSSFFHYIHYSLSSDQLSLLLQDQGRRWPPTLCMQFKQSQETNTSKSQFQIPRRGNLVGPAWVNCLCPEV